MAGIYLHIPFCRQACHYCDFHFSTSLKHKESLLSAMLSELGQRLSELEGQAIETIYFGGGTPSLLNDVEINRFFEVIQNHTSIDKVKEITLEANPDDLTLDKLGELRNTPINRLSIGVQSFFEADLKWMNRAHNAKQAYESIQNAHKMGFDNLTIDLIYGSPTTSFDMWKQNLDTWLELGIPHLSAYALTVEENTALYHQIKKGQASAPMDDAVIEQFEYLINFVAQHNVEHYEISNYARNEKYAVHNTSYWFGKPYLGIGPSAHSFDGTKTRRVNVANNNKYIKALINDEVFWETEVLSNINQMNEYLLTRLRTKWGLEKDKFIARFGANQWAYLQPQLHKHLVAGKLIETDNRLILSQTGKYIADGVIGELFF